MATKKLTSAKVTTYEGVTPENLEKLGKELIQAAAMLRAKNGFETREKIAT